jgi:hypothetical protein
MNPLSYDDLLAANRAANALISQQADEMAALQARLDQIAAALSHPEATHAEVLEDIAILRQLMCAGRDLEDTVKRYLERRDAGYPKVAEEYVQGMRRDVTKWEGVNRRDPAFISS